MNVQSIKLDTVNIQSNVQLILNISPIDHDKIIGSIESSNQSLCITLIDPSALALSVVI
jgi:hypothetical protein